MDRPLQIVLVEPEIHWNTGNIGRTCLAVGAQLHLVEPLGFSLAAKEVKRAGLDYWPQVDPQRWPSWTDFEARLPDLGDAFFISPDGEAPYWQAQFPQRSVLLFGRESTGLPDSIRAKYRERLYRLPMRADSVRSLNLSTCAGIVAYEYLRQQSF